MAISKGGFHEQVGKEGDPPYVLPERATERILPIAIEPAPKQLKRILVGRLECIAPEIEEEVAGAIKYRRSDDSSFRRAGQARLDRLGRFLEPRCRRVLAITKDDEVRRGAQEILDSTKGTK